MKKYSKNLNLENKDISFSAHYAKGAQWDKGLREFFEYRDLGVKGATNGQVKAHIIRVKDGGDTSTLHTTGLHEHLLSFQMIYILQGWIKFHYRVEKEEGVLKDETLIFGPGDCCVQPPGITHNELECSDDLELLEITTPAEYETVAV